MVVCSAGALHTPALLLRSGLKHDLIGTHLCLHPVIVTAGVVPGVLTGLSSGVGMGVAVKYPAADEQRATIDGTGAQSRLLELDAGWGVIKETPSAHPGLFSLLMPWRDGLTFKISTLAYKSAAAFVAIARDRSSRFGL